MKTTSLVGFALALLVTAPALAQQSGTTANAMPACTLTPAQAAASQKVAMDFATKTGEAKVALADPSYVQHNPANHRRAEQDQLSDYDEFKKTFSLRPQGAARAVVVGLPRALNRRQGIRWRSWWPSATRW